MTDVNVYFYSKDKPIYQGQLASGLLRNAWPLNFTMNEVPATSENFWPRIDKMSEKWGWNKKPCYTDGSLEGRLSHPETRLFDLCDNGVVVGYTLITAPSQALKDRFWKAANDVRVIEIENLGLFPDCEGNGRGKAYFEMCFDILFKRYDVVHWSQTDVHSPTLTNFYREKLGMTLLATDRVPDFRAKTLTREVA